MENLINEVKLSKRNDFNFLNLQPMLTLLVIKSWPSFNNVISYFVLVLI